MLSIPIYRRETKCSNSMGSHFEFIETFSLKICAKSITRNLLRTWLRGSLRSRLSWNCTLSSSSLASLAMSASRCSAVQTGYCRLLLQHRPVKRVVVLVVQRAEQNSEQLTKVHVIWTFLKTQPSSVVQVHRELSWEALLRIVFF